MYVVTQCSEQNPKNVAVIFDMDGVLVDSMRIQWKSWGKPAKKRGLSLPSEKDVMKRGGYKPCAFINEFWACEEFTPSDVEIFAEEKEEHFEELLFQDFPEMPGAKWLIKSLWEQGVDIAIGSSSSRNGVSKVVEKMGIKEYFRKYPAHTVSGEDVDETGEVVQSKPAPDIFTLAAKRLDRKPSECLVIEDAKAGVIAATRAGMQCIAFRSWGHEDEKYEVDNDNVVNALDENTLEKILNLLKILQEIS